MEISSRGNHARRAASPQALLLLLLLLVDSVPMFEGLCEGAEEYVLDLTDPSIGQAPSTVGPATLSQTISM